MVIGYINFIVQGYPSGADIPQDPEIQNVFAPDGIHDRRVIFTCGCETTVGNVAMEEQRFCNANPFVQQHPPVNEQVPGWRAPGDFSLVLVCFRCQIEITRPLSAYCIIQFCGFANWISHCTSEAEAAIAEQNRANLQNQAPVNNQQDAEWGELI
jgi:hypothetical protein